ncbi:MAG: hypothetical protein A2145_02580 [candidate division Zixibacteria bacterium RBG_16_40_9]|nr:MAG: hypothetical protein A2145_02580 [candidate division Zixibacteria bacterium RBG_16_40_9]
MDSDDQKLWREFKNGNSHAYETLFRRYKNQTYNFAYKMLGDKQSASDITQEVFIKLFKSQDNSKPINDLKNWLFILTRNLCLNKLRDSKKEIGLEAIEEESSENKIQDPQVLKLREALNQLEPNLKEALVLREYQGFSYQEIAEILDISVSAVKSLIFRARVKLKEIFEKIN